MPGPGDVVVVVGPPVAVLTSRGAVVVVLSTGSPAGAAGVRVAELLLLASTMTCCPCLLRLVPPTAPCPHWRATEGSFLDKFGAFGE